MESDENFFFVVFYFCFHLKDFTAKSWWFWNFPALSKKLTFVKGCQKSSIFIVKFSSGMSEIFFDTCVNWSCVTRCGCRTTSSSLFTVHPLTARRVCTHLPLVWGEDTLARRWGGGGVNILEDAGHCSVLYICKYFVSVKFLNKVHRKIGIPYLDSTREPLCLLVLLR